MTDKTYLFYDLETSGLNKCFDQVMQFAAIRTDLAFNELERHEIFVKLNPDVIPHPAALATHLIGLNDVADGICEYEAITKIHQLLNTPNTISIGYNTLGFDDEFLRFSFYRNLLAPYTHQYANHCSRMDLYPITVFYALFQPELLNWPEIDGKLSLKLENLNAANSLATGQAHNAMVDIEATIALAKKLASNQPMWDFCCKLFNKQQESDFIAKLPEYALMIDGKIGANNHFMAPVISLGSHQHYKNQSLWLRLDLQDFASLSKDTLLDDTRCFRKRLGEPPFLLPPNERYLGKINDTRLQTTQQNLAWLKQNPTRFQQLRQHYQELKYADIANLDLDAALYQRPFATPSDQSTMRRFHQAAVADKSALAEHFLDPLYQEQAHRLMVRNYPEAATEEAVLQFNQYLQQINVPDAVCDYRGERHLTKQEAKLQCEAWLQQVNNDQAKAILQAYLVLLSEDAITN